MNEQQNKPGTIKVPANAQHQVKVITADNRNDFEKRTNEFLNTISDEKRLVSLVFAINPKTGNLTHIINYSNITPMTPEEWKAKQDKQKKFASGFVPGDLMPNGAEVSKL